MPQLILIHEYLSGGGMPDALPPASLLAEGRAMSRAAACDFAALADTTVVRTFDARYPVEAGPWQAARVDPAGEREQMEALVKRADATLVIAPETGGLLSERVSWLRDWGARSLNSTLPAVVLAGDKWMTYLHILRHSFVRQPRTSLDPAEIPFPAVVKPIDGAGALATRWLKSADEIGDPVGGLYQEFVNGTPHSASFLIDRTGCVVAVGVARQHVDRANGNFVYRGGCAPAGDPSWCAEMARSLAQIEGLQGWVGVDFVATDTGATVFLEINPRLTTSFVGFQQVAGVGAIARVWWQGIERGFGSDAHELAARIAVAPPCTFTTMNSTERSAHANI